jgi:hypothetical protein
MMIEAGRNKAPNLQEDDRTGQDDPTDQGKL